MKMRVFCRMSWRDSHMENSYDPKSEDYIKLRKNLYPSKLKNFFIVTVFDEYVL